ncbi:MAG: hypothetical protein Q4C22_02205 [Bacillota bacterium]|nr:hypothetical protein [Bacillota bacterium]
MTSKTSWFSVSGSILRENFRRFWAIPVLAFLVYFLAGVFPILVNYRQLETRSYWISALLGNDNFFFMAAHLFFPVISAVVLFRFLQGASSVAMLHSMPFTRQRLFNSNFLSGLIMLLGPILLVALILLAISKPVYDGSALYGGAAFAENVFSSAAILSWLGESAIILGVVFAVAVFAGVVTGNVLMHFLFGLGFNFLLPGLYSVLTWYCGEYLFGFISRGPWAELGRSISPYINGLSDEHFSLAAILWYVFAFAALIVVSSLLYRRRKLERVGDPFTFNFLEPVIACLIAYLLMTLLGYYFGELTDDGQYVWAGYGLGAVLGFLIGQMIVKKSFRVFHRATLKGFCIYALIALVFFAFMLLDLTAFEKRVPELARVESATLESSWLDHSGVRTEDGEGGLRQPENLAAAVAFHQSVVENRQELKALEEETRLLLVYVELSESLGSDWGFYRSWRLPYPFVRDSEALKTIAESQEFKGRLQISGEGLEGFGLDYASLYNEQTGYGAVDIYGEEALAELVDCIIRDHEERTFEDMMSLSLPLCALDIVYSYKSEMASEGTVRSSHYVQVTEGSVHTIAWLEENGYGRYLGTDPASVFYATVSEVKDGVASYEEVYDDLFLYEGDYAYTKAAEPAPWTEEGNSASPVAPEPEEGLLVVTDTEEIAALLEMAESESIDRENYYYVHLVMAPFAEETEEGQAGLLAGETLNLYFHLNEDRVPDFVTEYFQ